MLLDIFDTVVGGINSLSQSLGFSWISVIALILLLTTLVVSFIATIFSSELKTARAVEKLNAYLESNPFINDENLVEFNKLMKKIPAPMRSQWQQFMVNRDKKPSEFFTEDNCIEKPFKASGYKNHIVAIRTITICIAILSFVFCCGAASNATSTLAVVLIESLILPLLIVFIGELYLLFLKTRRNSAIGDLYNIFMNFQHSIDRAVTTLPDYVDYEILFTRKEIVGGIPVLQQYLQQRALFEQEQIKKAKESQVEHEEYDFSSLGINGSLVMERAMRECEYYLGNRKRVLAEISELQGSRDLLEKSYEEKNKTNQRKLRDIQESLDRLKEKLDNTTNIIVGNDLRKQRENEIQKQRQLEKEVEQDNNKYDADKKAIEKQIEEKREEIEGFRKTAESALNGEFKTYADKIYVDLKAIVDAEYREELDGIKANNQELQVALEERDRTLAEKTVMYDEKLQMIEEYSNRIAEQEQTLAELSTVSNGIDEEINSRDHQIQSKDREIFEINKTLESRKIEIEKKNKEIENLKATVKDLKRKKQVEVFRYFDANGNEFYIDENGNPYYADENGNPIYAETESAEQNIQNPVEEQVTEQVKGEITEEVVEQPVTEDELNLDETQVEKPAEQSENFEQVDFDADSLFDEPVDNKPVDANKQPEKLSTEDIEDLIAKIDNDNKEEDESKKAKPIPEFHKPVDNFKWENSNSPEKFDAEPQAEQKEVVAEPAKEDNKSTDIEKPAKEQPVDQNIDEIEKEIANQNAELDKQTKNLSAQLEETKAIAESQVKTDRKNPAKKSAPKKSAPKKAASKKTTKKPSTKKPASKTTSKKTSAKKPTEKPKTAKPATKKSNTAKSKKPVAKKVDTKKPVNKKKNDTNNGDITVGDLSLMEFNEQLKSVLKEININDK